jgi:hypothetical protein
MDPNDYDRMKAASTGPGSEPVLVGVGRTCDMLGIGRTKAFELIRDGLLIARKIGSRTLVETESIRRFAASLPRVGRAA